MLQRDVCKSQPYLDERCTVVKCTSSSYVLNANLTIKHARQLSSTTTS